MSTITMLDKPHKVIRRDINLTNKNVYRSSKATVQYMTFLKPCVSIN